MTKYLFLDGGPLGLASKKPDNPKAEQCRRWINELQSAGHIVVIPEIVDYEVRREILRCKHWDWLARLDAMASSLSYLRITTEAMRRAAEFWAELRQGNMQTADSKELDCDVILAAQAVTAIQPGDVAIVATTNIGHLARFKGIEVKPWSYLA